jgi:hypothetical protein
MPATLSTDLLDKVVDEIAGDKPALSACALASSFLRRRARYHLFSVVDVTSLARATAFADVLDADAALGASIVWLHAWVGLTATAWQGTPGRAGLCALLPRLPSLAALKISNIMFFEFEHESGVGALAAALPASLRRLAFS